MARGDEAIPIDPVLPGEPEDVSAIGAAAMIDVLRRHVKSAKTAPHHSWPRQMAPSRSQKKARLAIADTPVRRASLEIRKYRAHWSI